jgi:hypothetical protein
MNMNKKKIILWVIAGLLALFLAVQIINTAKYSMVVQVVEGENVAGLNPTTERLDFGDLSRNNRLTRHVAMRNSGSIPTFVIVWKFGELAELVEVNKNFFTLQPGQETRLSFELFIPSSAEFRKYSGWVWIFRLPKVF